MIKNTLKQNLQNERFNHRVIVTMLIVIVLLIYKVTTFSNQITVYTAPDISKSFLQKAGHVPSSTIYGFARALWENLNYCENDCGVDISKNLIKYRAFLTNSCFDKLETHVKSNFSLYSGRKRYLLPGDNANFSDDKVQQQSLGLWDVPLEFLIVDTSNGDITRSDEIAYPIRVVRSKAPLANNPWGLAIDCFYADGPKYIKSKELAK